MQRAFVVLVLFATCVPNLLAQANVKIEAKDFPSVAARIPFFEKRINAADAKIRSQVVDEARRLFYVKGKDYVQFFERMMRDEDVAIRGAAINKLHELWGAE